MPPDLDIDLEALQARGTLPRCPECGLLARPNVMMFGDVGWVADATKAQQAALRKVAGVGARQALVILELGAGTAIATIRSLGERLAASGIADDAGADQSGCDRRGRAGGADPDDGARGADADRGEVPEGFRERCRVAAVPGPDLRSHEEISRASMSTSRRPGRIASTQAWDHLELIKWRKTYSKAWQITMPSGYVAWVDRIDVERNYLGMISGLAGTPYVQRGDFVGHRSSCARTRRARNRW